VSFATDLSECAGKNRQSVSGANPRQPISKFLQVANHVCPFILEQKREVLCDDALTAVSTGHGTRRECPLDLDLDAFDSAQGSTHRRALVSAGEANDAWAGEVRLELSRDKTSSHKDLMQKARPSSHAR